jgi:hypothetical protein
LGDPKSPDPKSPFSRDKEEKEIGEKMGKGIIGAEGFGEEVGKKMIDAKRPRRGRPRK